MRTGLVIIFLFIIRVVNAQVGIGTTSPHASSLLDVSATDKGVLMPRMTAAQRTAITGAATGLLVFQTDGASGFYYYTGSAWTNLSTGTSSIPTGTVMSYAGSSVPAGWALCDGSAISRTSNAALYTVIGVIYGTGNGSTTFNVPDLRGRTIFGLDNMGGTAAGRLTTAGGLTANNSLGATGGDETTTLSIANMPAHTHTFTGSAVTSSSYSHTHTYTDAYFAENVSGGTGGNARFGHSGATDSDNSFYFRTSSNTHSTSPSNINTGSDSHTHTVTAAGTNSSAGSGSDVRIVNPALVMNYIIKL